MELREFHQLVSTEALLDLFYKIDETNCIYFKSKFNDLEFLAYGNFTKHKVCGNDSIYFLEGNFEGDHHFLKFENYIYRFENDYHLNLNRVPHFKSESKIPRIKNKVEIEDQIKWSQMLEVAINKIKENTYQKIVLSRSVEIEFDSNPLGIIKDIFSKNKYNYQIYKKINKQTFISVTPEMFFNIDQTKNNLKVMALAGSMPKTTDQNINNENQIFLRENPKLVSEHQIVVEEIERRLKQINNQVFTSNLQIMELPYIYHREKTVECKLDNHFKLEEIIQLLHPTPAVGTMPYQNGIEIINQIENKKRNFYAAPIGIISNRIIDLAVGLRSALVEDNKMTLYSGCGLTIDSEAESEWKETENKLKPFLSVLNYE